MAETANVADTPRSGLRPTRRYTPALTDGALQRSLAEIEVMALTMGQAQDIPNG